jgi:hypothetical protein
MQDLPEPAIKKSERAEPVKQIQDDLKEIITPDKLP